jgi:hypothetical protein
MLGEHAKIDLHGDSGTVVRVPQAKAWNIDGAGAKRRYKERCCE